MQNGIEFHNLWIVLPHSKVGKWSFRNVVCCVPMCGSKKYSAHTFTS